MTRTSLCNKMTFDSLDIVVDRLGNLYHYLIFDPNAMLFLLQRYHLVAIVSVVATLCTFGCDK